MDGQKYIDLETERNPAVAFSDLLSRIHTRPMIECERAWDLFDNIAPGDMMAIINQWATETPSTVEIFKIMQIAFDARGIKDPKALELMALATEYSVRKNAA